MKEYIEREAVIRLIETEGFNEKYDLGHPKDNDWFCEEVNRIPAADVVEVRHGRWKTVHDEVYYWMACSVCGEEIPKRFGTDYYTNYCPNCGAKMDGGIE